MRSSCGILNSRGDGHERVHGDRSDHVPGFGQADPTPGVVGIMRVRRCLLVQKRYGLAKSITRFAVVQRALGDLHLCTVRDLCFEQVRMVMKENA